MNIYKNKFIQFREFYRILYQGLRTTKYMSRPNEHGLSPEFIRKNHVRRGRKSMAARFVLFHTKICLGAKAWANDEIQNFWLETADSIPSEELSAFYLLNILCRYQRGTDEGVLGPYRIIITGRKKLMVFWVHPNPSWLKTRSNVMSTVC